MELLEQCLGKTRTERPTAQEVVQELKNQLMGSNQEKLTGLSPFRGLVSFEEEHSPLYFGREVEIISFVERLRQVPILPVVGPSGAGKSSFVKAGVIPRLREKGPLILLQLRPGREPFFNLASRLVTAWQQPTSSMVGLENRRQKLIERPIGEATELAKQLYEQPHLLSLWLQRIAEQHRAHVVLFVDQLEEVCALESKEELKTISSVRLSRSTSSIDIVFSGGVSERFMQALAFAADDPQSPVRVILTVREEFLTRLMTDSQVREALNRIMVLQPPGHKTLISILENSAKAVGYKFEDFYLTKELVKDLQGSKTSLPLLQFAGQVLWQNRDENRKVLTRAAYEEMGGVTGALVQHAEGVLKSLTNEEVGVAKDLFLRLVTEDKARKIMSRDELLEGLKPEAEKVLGQLIESRLVTISRKHEGETGEGDCELVHESLIAQWNRLNHWIDESREELALLNQLKQAAQFWNKRGKRTDDLWSKQALQETEAVLDQAISQGTLYSDFIQESRRHIRKGRNRLSAIVGFMFLVVIAAVWAGNHLLRGELCTGAEEKIVGVWNPEVKENINKAFLGTGVSYAKDTVGRVFRLFDSYTSEWKDHYTQACEATHVRGEQSFEILDLRMGCLRERLGEIKALQEVFSEADKKVVEKSVKAAMGLEAISRCDKVNSLIEQTQRIKPPRDEATKKKVEKIREKIAKVEAMQEAGKYQEGVKLAKEVVVMAEETGYLPVQAESMYELGLLQEKAAQDEEARKTLEEAALFADKSRHDEVRARALSELIYTVGYKLARYEEAEQWSRLAEAAVSRIDDKGEIEARWLNHAGILCSNKGDYDKALQYYQESLRIFDKALGKEHPDVATIINNLGNVYNFKGEQDKALQYLQESLRIREKALGKEHPYVAMSLNNLGLLYKNKGEYDKAIQYYQESLRISEKALGKEHPYVAMSLNNLGNVYNFKGEYDKAIQIIRKAIRIREKTLGKEHPYVATSLNYLGDVYTFKGEYDKALQYYQESLRISEKALGKDHPDGAPILSNLGKVYNFKGEYDKAIQYYHGSLIIYEKALGKEHPHLAWALSGMGDVFVNQRRYKEALETLKRVVTLCETKTCEPEPYGRGLFGLFRALVATGGEKERAIKLAQQAREIFGKTPKRFKKEIEEVDAWLKKHDGSVEEYFDSETINSKSQKPSAGDR